MGASPALTDSQNPWAALPLESTDASVANTRSAAALNPSRTKGGTSYSSWKGQTADSWGRGAPAERPLR